MPSQDLELIKSKIDIVDFLKSYLNLLPAGKSLKGLCPFHQEKTPSFVVSPERKIWHCFGCGAGGDAIKFVMLYENLEFPAALRFIAEKLGIALSAATMREQREFNVLYDIHEKTRNFFRDMLAQNPEAQKYLAERGILEKTIDEFELGYAPGGETLTLHLTKSGYDINDIVRAGLSHKNTRGLFRDRFDRRIIFPLYNSVGKVVAFTGRLLPALQRTDETFDIEPPKYLNSPETPIFNKSKILYGLHKTKHAIVQSKSVFLVEGQMDFLSVWQAGVLNAVAVSGTGLTAQHLSQLRRLADIILVSFDNDDAGIKALERSIELLSDFDFHIKAVGLGTYKDPADAAQGDAAFFSKAIPNAKPAFLYLFDHYFSGLKSDPDNIVSRKRIIRELLKKLLFVKSAVEQDILLKELSGYAGISEVALGSELAELRDFEKPQNKQEEEPRAVFLDRIDMLVERLLVLGFTRNDFWDILCTKRAFLPQKYHPLMDDPKSDAANFFAMKASYENGEKDVERLRKEFDTLVRYLEIEFLKQESAKAQTAITDMGESENEEHAALMAKFHSMAQRINELRSS